MAQEYLKKLGYEILETNVHFSKNAEVDIIAKDKNTIVFVEVKTRKTLEFGHPFEAINHAKLEKIKIGALNYLADKKTTNWRIDGIAVIGTDNPKIEHLKNIGYM